MIDRYRYAEGRLGVVELNVPKIDREIAALALLCLVRRKSAGILYPFPESDFSILPLLGPLAHLLVGVPGYFVLVSRSYDWKEVYGKVRRSESEGRGESLRYLHPFGAVGMDGRIISHATSLDSTKKTNIVFSRASSLSSLVWNDEIRGLVVDVGPPRARIDSRRIADLVDMASAHSIPWVVIFCNPSCSVRGIIEERGIGILSWQCGPEVDETDVSSQASAAHPVVGLDFNGSYEVWSSKIRMAKSMPRVELLELEDTSELSQELKELNLDLYSLLRSANLGSSGLAEQNLLAFASFLESRVRTLWTRKVDFNRAALQSYCGEALESSLQRFSQTSRQLYERNAKVAIKAIAFADRYDRVLKMLDITNTSKSKQVEHIIRHHDSPEMFVFLNYGRIPQKAFSVFSEFCGSDKTKILSASAKNLSLIPRVEKIFLPGYPLFTNAYLLATSSTPDIVVVCYPWETSILKSRVSALENQRAVWVSNSKTLLRNILTGESMAVPTRSTTLGELAEITTVETHRERGTSMSVTGDGFSYRDLVDFLEVGERPESDILPQCVSGIREYRDAGTESKWLITTDQGRLYVNETRKMTVVSLTYSDQIEPGKTGIGDIIMVGKDFNPRPMSDYVWDLMAMKGISKEGAIWREWKRRLKEFVDTHPGEDSESVLERLKELGTCDIQTPQAVYAWLSSDDLIGPQRKDTIMCIGKLLDANSAECELWWASILQVRSALHSAYSHLWKLVKYHASSLAAGDSEDVLVSPELDIWLSDLAELVSFARVISQPQHLPG